MITVLPEFLVIKFRGWGNLQLILVVDVVGVVNWLVN